MKPNHSPQPIYGHLCRSIGKGRPPKPLKTEPLLSDAEYEAQRDFIEECRKPHPKPGYKQLKQIVNAERVQVDYPIEFENLPPDEFLERVKQWRNS